MYFAKKVGHNRIWRVGLYEPLHTQAVNHTGVAVTDLGSVSESTTREGRVGKSYACCVPNMAEQGEPELRKHNNVSLTSKRKKSVESRVGLGRTNKGPSE
jgi:hypothetical protein